MYLDFFRLEREPFHITPDPDFLFPSPSHNEALAAIIYGAEHRKGFVALTGEVGTGKTTILRAYLRREEGTSIIPIYLFHPDLSFRDLIIKLLRELGLESGDGSTMDLLERLQTQLIEDYRANRTPVLIIDEAQNMPIETLEQLRMLTNLETSKDKLLQVVLVGQPELDEILDQHSLRQLKQRISLRSKILPLTDTEVAAYIRSRTERAGGDAKFLFTDGAIREVVRMAGGIPRTINTLCDNALIAGYGLQQRPVGAKMVREAARDLQMHVPRSSTRKLVVAAAMIAAIAVAGGAYVFMNGSSERTEAAESYAVVSDTEFPPTENPDAGLTEAASSEENATPELSSVAAPETETSLPGGDADSPEPTEAPEMENAESPDPLERLGEELLTRTQPASGNRDAALATESPIQIEVRPVEASTLSPVDTSPPFDTSAPTAASPISAETPVLIPDAPTTQPVVVAAAPEARKRTATLETRVVKSGDCLSKLIADVYKAENYRGLVDFVMQENPGISDPDALQVGMLINFPKLKRSQSESL